MKKQKFADSVAKLQKEIEQVSKAIDEISASKHFRLVLTYVLKCGNYLNGGTKNGQAYGFQLSTMLKVFFHVLACRCCCVCVCSCALLV